MKIDNRITNLDSFCEMHHDAQLVYFHLCANANEDRMVLNPRGICRQINATLSILETLDNYFFITLINGNAYITEYEDYARYVDEMYGED